MSQAHVRDFSQRIQAFAPSKYFISVVEPLRREDELHRVVQLVNRKDALAVAQLRVETLPGCCGVALLSHFQMWGKSKLTDMVRLIISSVLGAKAVRYGMAMLTLLADSELIPLLEQQGWVSGNAFRNGKTDNMVVVLVYDLGQPTRERVRNNTGGE